jgi:hypothetical protein
MNPNTAPVVKFPPNQPIILTVKYGSLKPCRNGSFLLSTREGSAFFNSVDANRIQELQLHPGEKLECLYKRIGKEEAFAFSKIAEPQQPETMESKPAAAATQRGLSRKTRVHRRLSRRRLCQHTIPYRRPS